MTLPKDWRACGAKCRNGKLCTRPAQSNGRCHMHGGPTPSGVAHHAYQGKGYSKYLPVRMADRYNEAIRDPDLLSLRHEIALLDTRLADVLASVESGDSAERVRDLRKLRQQYARADEEDRQDVLDQILYSIDALAEDRSSWQEIREIVGNVRTVKESERKRLVEMQSMISNEQAMTLVVKIMAIIKSRVTDIPTLRLLAADFRDLAVYQGSGPTEADLVPD